MKFNFSAAVSQYSVSFGIICVSGTQSVHSKLKGSQQGTFVLYRKKTLSHQTALMIFPNLF